MSKPLLIKDVTKLKAFEPAIKLQAISADLGNHYFQDYILTEELANVYDTILSSVLGDGWGSTASTLPAERRRSHLITAQYGTGKSYFLLILSALLGAAGDTARLQSAKNKFGTFRDVQSLLGRLADMKFLVIQISAEDKGDIRFKELLVRSLLQQVTEVIPDVAFTNEYTKAIDHLEEVERTPAGELLAQVLEEQCDTSLQQLRARLGAYDRDGLRIYYQACERAWGRQVSRDVLDVEATFQEALELLASEGYTQIAVLVDELTAYLNASERHHSLAETLGELQSFAAYCNRPTNRCLLVGAMHESARDFLKEKSLQRLYDKMKGRFDEHMFPVYSSKLLAGVFQPDEHAFEKATKKNHRQVEELTDLIATLKMQDDDRSMKLSDFFPLHPAVAHYLPRVSRVLGQAERTSFGFIDEVVRRKLEEPLAIGGRLNLVTLDHVFDYFLSAMEQRDFYGGVIAAYNVVENKLADPLAHKAFKPLALLWMAARVRSEEAYYLQTDLSADQVADFIGVDDSLDVLEALQQLCSTGYVYFDTSTQRYFFSHAEVGWDVESEIQEEMSQVDPDHVLESELRALGPRVCPNAPNTVTVKVERSVESQWVNIEQLMEIASIKPRRADGRAVFVIPGLADVERYSAVLSDITQKARELSATNVTVAVPQMTDMLNPTDLKRYRALQEIGKRVGVGKQDGVSEHRVRVIQARFSEVRARVQQDIEAFGRTSNFIFFVNRQPQQAQDLNTILVEMFDRHYWKFPKLKVERINGRSTTNALIDSCIANSRYVFPSDTSEVARQARDTLQVLGLCSWEKIGGGKYEVRLKEPEPGGAAYEIWKIVLDTLTGDSNRPLTTLYKDLEEAPYGLPYYIVELYVAAAKALKKVYILDKNGKMPPVGKQLVADMTKRKDSDYRVLPVQETEVPYTYICSVWQAIDERLGLRHYQGLQKNLGRTVDEQRTWFDLKADCNNLLNNQLDQVRINLAAIEAESGQFGILLKHLESIKRILAPADGFAELAALGESLSGVKVSTDLDTVASAVRESLEATGGFSTAWNALEAAYRRYRQLQRAADLDRFGTLAKNVAEAWQVCSREALSAETRQAFMDQFELLWSEYVEQYVDEHNVVSRARRSFGKQVENSLAYELVDEFSRFGFEGIATKTSFDARIEEERKHGCQALSEDTMSDYQRFGKANCSCGYHLGTDTEILRRLQEREESLVTGMNNALDSYLAELDGALEAGSVHIYSQEKATPEEKTTLASVRVLVSRDQQLAEREYRKLRVLLPQTRAILRTAEEYLKEQATKRRELEKQLEDEKRQRRIPRVPTARLGDHVRSFLLDSGLESMTLKELEERLATWLQEMAREFKRQA